MRRAVALAALFAFGCASIGAFRAGEQAEHAQDYDRAVREYARAVQLAPDNLTYRKSLERARLRAAAEHASASGRLTGRGLYKEAKDELQLAVNLNPSAGVLQNELRELEARLQPGARTPTIAEVKEKARERALPGLALGPAAR